MPYMGFKSGQQPSVSTLIASKTLQKEKEKTNKNFHLSPTSTKVSAKLCPLTILVVPTIKSYAIPSCKNKLLKHSRNLKMRMKIDIIVTG